MLKILFASVPLSGHVNPAVPIVSELVESGHEVYWYCGLHYQKQIEKSGAKFLAYNRAFNYHDSSIQDKFPDLPYNSLLKHASYYIKHIFFDNMTGQFEDLTEIVQTFHPDIIVTDEWFCGVIPLKENTNIPWICYCNSPLFFYDDVVPFPGAGIYPREDLFGVNRNRIVNFLVTKIFFRGVQNYINKIRRLNNLGKMKHFFLINNIYLCNAFVKFNTPAFEFKWKHLPDSIKFVGPVIPKSGLKCDFAWIDNLKTGKPVIFLTQGSVNINDYNSLILPVLKALSESGMIIVVATGNGNNLILPEDLKSDNIIIESFIPYEFILPLSDLMITNGGFGGVITALSFGVPLIIKAGTEDKPEIAARVEYFKTGINLGKGRLSTKKIRNAVDNVLNNPVYKINAQNISSEFKKYDSIRQTIEIIESEATKSKQDK